MTYGPYKLGGYTTPQSNRKCGRERLIEATQDGLLDPQTVVEMCARWLTSAEIYAMCTANEIYLAGICDD